MATNINTAALTMSTYHLMFGDQSRPGEFDDIEIDDNEIQS